MKIGYTTSPHWRFTTLPLNDGNDVEPHYLRWSNMIVVYGGSGPTASALGRKLILQFRESERLQNDLPGENGPIGEIGFTYVLWNSLDDVVGHYMSSMKQEMRHNDMTFCSNCRMLTMELKNYHGLFATACACAYARYPMPR